MKKKHITIYTWWSPRSSIALYPYADSSSNLRFQFEHGVLRTNGGWGHSALRTYSVDIEGKKEEGVYVSFYPGNCNTAKRIPTCRSSVSHFHTLAQEAQELDGYILCQIPESGNNPKNPERRKIYISKENHSYVVRGIDGSVVEGKFPNTINLNRPLNDESLEKDILEILLERKQIYYKATAIDLYGFEISDILAINNAFRAMHDGNMNSLKPWGKFYNCSDVILFLLKKGNLFERIEYNPFSLKMLIPTSLLFSFGFRVIEEKYVKSSKNIAFLLNIIFTSIATGKLSHDILTAKYQEHHLNLQKVTIFNAIKAGIIVSLEQLISYGSSLIRNHPENNNPASFIFLGFELGAIRDYLDYFFGIHDNHVKALLDSPALLLEKESTMEKPLSLEKTFVRNQFMELKKPLDLRGFDLRKSFNIRAPSKWRRITNLTDLFFNLKILLMKLLFNTLDPVVIKSIIKHIMPNNIDNINMRASSLSNNSRIDIEFLGYIIVRDLGLHLISLFNHQVGLPQISEKFFSMQPGKPVDPIEIRVLAYIKLQAIFLVACALLVSYPAISWALGSYLASRVGPRITTPDKVRNICRIAKEQLGARPIQLGQHSHATAQMPHEKITALDNSSSCSSSELANSTSAANSKKKLPSSVRLSSMQHSTHFRTASVSSNSNQNLRANLNKPTLGGY